jgi:hypothetical protein
MLDIRPIRNMPDKDQIIDNSEKENEDLLVRREGAQREEFVLSSLPA